MVPRCYFYSFIFINETYVLQFPHEQQCALIKKRTHNKLADLDFPCVANRNYIKIYSKICALLYKNKIKPVKQNASSDLYIILFTKKKEMLYINNKSTLRANCFLD